MKKIGKILLIVLLLIIAMKAYSGVYMNVSNTQKQLFIKYFSTHTEQFEECYMELNDMDKVDKEILDKIPEEIKVLDMKSFLQKLNQKENVRNKYFIKLAEILDIGECAVDEFVEVELNGEIKLADRYKTIMSEKELLINLTSIAKQALEDVEFLELCEDTFTSKQIQDLKILNDEYINMIEKMDPNNEFLIAVYVKDGVPVRTDFINTVEQFSYQIIDNSETENILKLSIKEQ